MRTLFHSLNILNWPMWVKLAAGFLFAIGVPVALLVVIAHGSFVEINTENLKSYLEEQSTRQVRNIEADLQQSRDRIDEFINNPVNHSLVKLNLQTAAAVAASAQQLNRLLQSELAASNRFREFYLLDQNGTMLLRASADNTLRPNVGLAYEQANTALLQNHDESIAISNNPVTIQLTHAIRESSGTLTGFFVTTLNYEAVITAHLIFENPLHQGYSYLIGTGDDPVLLVQDEFLDEAQVSRDASVVVPLALRGTTNTEAYAIGSQKDQQVIGHYSPVLSPILPNPILFALITEASAEIPVNQATTYFTSARLFPIVVGLALIFVLLVVLFNQIITPSLMSLKAAIQGTAHGDFDQAVLGAARGDEIGEVSAAFVDMRVQVRNLLNDLEARVAARTRDIVATQEISKFTVTQRNLQTLLDQVVQLIVEQFPNIYHAQIFLLDQDRLFAVLRASTGEPGKILLARGHRLAVGSVSVIGQVVEQQQTIIARDTATSQVHRRNEFLPDTRAELAIPLRVADQIIGALDVQSRYRNAFTNDEVQVLQTMADQIAVAIENARLYQETVRRLEDLDRANRTATLKTWQEYIYGQRQRSLISEAGTRTETDMSDLRRQALTMGRIVTGKPTANNTVPVAVPIQLRGQTLGAVEWELPLSDLTDNKLQLAQELANRLAVSLDNARLFEESQRATERERIVNAIAAKLTPQTEINEILQTAVREVGQALRAPQVSIRLNRSNDTGNGSNGTNGHNAANGSNGVNGSHE
jgi:GAF domain-containing protein